jgi:hypothetical protein
MSKAREIAELGDAVTVDAGNVGIGTSSPSETLHIRNTSGGENGAILIESFAPNIKFNDLSSPVPDYQISVNSSFKIKRDSAGDGTFESTDLTINSNGTIDFGTGSGAVGGVSVLPNYSAGTGMLYWNRTTTASAGTALRFDDGGFQKGSITYTSSATSYNTSSDYRLKENITPVQGAADIVKAMKPCTYTFKSDGSWHDGFLAHELQELHPRAVIGSKDAMQDEEYEVTPAVLDEDGAVVTEAVMGTRSVPDYQGVDYSKLTPILTAALQEALNKIDALEAQNATFEARLAALEAV